MNLYCIGSGSPVVVFESGLAEPTSTWGAVQPEVAKKTTACAYDRAGAGFSDPGRRPATSANIAGDLHRLLAVAGIRPPYVLVAHSYGGLPARYFARRYPREVVGMVLVDTTHEDEIVVKHRVDPAFETAFMQPVYKLLDECVAQAKLGFQPGSALYASCVGGPDPRFSGEINAARISQRLNPAYQEAVRSESLAAASGESGEQVRKIGRGLGDMPLVVLTAPRAKSPPTKGSTRELHAAMDRLYTSGMQSIARLSSRGVYEPVHDTGHYIQITRPDIVEAAINHVLDQVVGNRVRSTRGNSR